MNKLMNMLVTIVQAEEMELNFQSMSKSWDNSFHLCSFSKSLKIHLL